MIKIIRDLLKYDVRFRFAFAMIGLILLMVLVSFLSPYAPNKTFVVAMDASPSLEHPFGTTSRGQDLFWWMTFGVRNSLLLGLMTALISRVIAIAVGLTAGYRGGWIDRVLMSINDSFVVMPLLPILILLGFLFKGQLNLYLLAVLLGLFGWPWDARLIRSQVLSLKQRAFTQNGVLQWSAVVAHHDRRAPAFRPTHRVRHVDQQHAVVDGNGGHAEHLGPVRPEPAEPRHLAVLGEPTPGLGRRRLVVDRRPGAGGDGAVRRPVPVDVERQRVHRSPHPPSPDRSLMWNPC